jgi:hypothetical protein
MLTDPDAEQSQTDNARATGDCRVANEAVRQLVTDGDRRHVHPKPQLSSHGATLMRREALCGAEGCRKLLS